jgi:tetratricopeptide (TPR) repeat protein
MISLPPITKKPPKNIQNKKLILSLYLQIGDRAQLPVALARLAWLYLGQHAYGPAQTCAQESLILTEAIGDVMGAAWLLKLHGDLAREQADYALAEADYRAARERFIALGSKDGLADALVGLGRVAAATGQTERARALWSEALSLSNESDPQHTNQWLLALLAGLPPASSAVDLA